jgi:hypothetical protein
VPVYVEMLKLPNLPYLSFYFLGRGNVEFFGGREYDLDGV